MRAIAVAGQGIGILLPPLNYFPQNQLAKFSACSLNNGSTFKSGGTNNLRVNFKRAENFFELLYAELSH